MGEAAERWRHLVEGRIQEMEELRGTRVDGGAFWNKRARQFARGPLSTADKDPMLPRLRRAAGAASRRATVLDVGAGPGRFSLAIADRAERVVAVDPSSKMLAILRRRAREAGIANVKTVTGTWMDAAVEPADVVLCSHVLPLIADAVPFVTKLDAMARRRVLLYVGAFSADAVLDPFWRYFHDTPRRPGATWVDAVRLLEDMGIRPDIEVVEVRNRNRYATVADAVENYRDQLALPKTAAVDRDLHRLIEPWLQRRDGQLSAPFRSQPAAILSWSPAQGF
ncbi:MAG: class I SAM-dependent methyltransferase [Acidimicrobiales bacterium]